MPHHVTRHAEMEQHFRIATEVLGTLLDQRKRLRVVALFIQRPAQRVGDSGLVWSNRPRPSRQLHRLVGLIQVRSIQVGEVVQRYRRI